MNKNKKTNENINDSSLFSDGDLLAECVRVKKKVRADVGVNGRKNEYAVHKPEKDSANDRKSDVRRGKDKCVFDGDKKGIVGAERRNEKDEKQKITCVSSSKNKVKQSEKFLDKKENSDKKFPKEKETTRLKNCVSRKRYRPGRTETVMKGISVDGSVAKVYGRPDLVEIKMGGETRQVSVWSVKNGKYFQGLDSEFLVSSYRPVKKSN